MNFKDAVRSGEFFIAKDLASKMDGETLLDTLFLLAYEEESIAPLGFANYLLLEDETAENHYKVSFLLCMALNYINGAYQTSFHHAKKAMELSPNDNSYKEFLLFFNSLPEKLLSNQEAIAIAYKILENDSNNNKVLSVINELNN